MAKKDDVIVNEEVVEVKEEPVVAKKEAAIPVREVTPTPISAPVEPTYDGSNNQVHEISPIIKMAIDQAAARKAHDEAHGFK